MSAEQRTEFYKLLDELIEGLKPCKKETFVITQDKYDHAISALQLPKGAKCPDGAYFKYWCTKKFKLHKIGSTTVLYCQKMSCPVITKEEMFDTIKRCHERVGHSGRDKTWDEIRSNYGWIKHEAVLLFLKTCSSCTVRRPLKKPAAKKPIISLGFLTRVQIDLIDMTSRPDGEYKWILHMRDHYSKFSWTHPLESKHAAGVAEKLVQTFCLFGCPRILHSDNGKEFVNHVIEELRTEWPGMIIIHGSPRHPQSQGCVERGNGDLQKKIGKWLEEHPTRGWSDSLQFVTYAINTSTSTATNKTPYEIVFGQSPRTEFSLMELLQQEGMLEEDVVPQHFIEELPTALDTESIMQPSTSKASSEINCEHELLDSGSLIATGKEMKNQTTVHGVQVTKNEGVFQITSVHVEDHVPARGNPFDEPIQVGQFTIWKLTETSSITQPDTPHDKVRKSATENYLKTANKQKVKYNQAIADSKKYKVGDMFLF